MDKETEGIPVNLPWEPGTEEWMNPETNVTYLVDEPQIDEKDNDTVSVDMYAVSSMINRANEEGLLVEVIWTLAQLSHGTVREKCFHALYEWDC